VWPWQRKRSGSPESPSVIGATVRIKGRIESEGDMTIYGQIDGDIVHDGRLVIGEGAHCISNIRAVEIELAGEVHGNLFVENGLHLRPTARLYGDTRCQSIQIDDGALFSGTNRMADAPLRLPAPAPAHSGAARAVLAEAVSASLAILMEPVGIAEKEMLGIIPVQEVNAEETTPGLVAALEPDPVPAAQPEVLPEAHAAPAPTARLEAPAFYGGFAPAFRTSKIA